MTDLRARFSPSRSTARGTQPLLPATLALALALGLLACQSKNDSSVDASGAGRPQAAFAQDRTQGAPGVEVQFSDASTGDITGYAWDFGAAGTASVQNPRVRFDAAGVYAVSLTVSGPGARARCARTP